MRTLPFFLFSQLKRTRIRCPLPPLVHHRSLHASPPATSHSLEPSSSSSSSSSHDQQQQQDQDEDQESSVVVDPKLVSTIFHIITSSPSPQSMSHSLLSHPISSSALLDQLLKRARFAHANPFRTLDFFNLITATSSNHDDRSFNKPTFTPSPFAYDTMLYILGRSRRFPECWSLLLSMRRRDPSLVSPRTLHVLLARVAKACSVRQTVYAFRKFRKIAPNFDTACFNALLRALCQEKTMADARNVYHSLKHEFRPDLQTFNTLLSGWKTVEDAEGFFGEMRDLNVEPDLVTYNCLIDVYCKNKEVAKARKVFDEMREREIYPDVISYTSLIGGLGLIGQPDKAREVLKEMREAGCCPDVAAYNAAIRNFCIAKRMGDAFGLVDEMRTKGLAPNATSYNLFFRVFYWANDLESSWRLYKRMKGDGCLPNVQSCMFLVRLFKKHEKVEMGLELWGDMVEKGFGSFRLVSDVLFELLCDWGKLEEAEKCFLQMVELGQKPSNISFRRIKVLMELANRHESVRNLSEKMASFGNSMNEEDKKRERKREERSLEMFD
nr:pentatricopeptide repeat protein AaPPR781 [Agave angustifolia]